MSERAWTIHHAASAAVGLAVRQLEHPTKDAVVSVSPLGDGTSTISVSVRVPANEVDAMAQAETLLDELASAAVETRERS